MKRCCTCLLVGVVCAVGPAAGAAVSHHRGFDRVTGPSNATATNALAAEAGWLAAAAGAGPVHHADFEGLTAGATGETFTIAPGVTMTAVGIPNLFPATLEVRDAPMPLYPLINGFNTTTGGAKHVRYFQADGTTAAPSVRFTFDEPVAAFSTYATGGLQPTIPSASGSTNISQGLNIITNFGDTGFPYWPSFAQPNVRFGGFVDPSASYTSLVVSFRFFSTAHPFQSGSSLDDVRWVYAKDVPEPGVLTVGAMGWWLVAGRRRRGGG